MKRWGLPLILSACLLWGLASWTGCVPRGNTGAPRSLVPSSEATSATPAATPALETTPVPPSSTSPPITFAVIGDFGSDDASERAVAKLVASRKPSFILTTGDNYYVEAGGSGTARYERAVGAFYGAWLKGTTSGSRHPIGSAAVNSFFPTMGNHDYSDAHGPETYLSYFTLPGAGFANTSGNERYYEFVEGPVHFFALDSNSQEPAGTSPDSMQGRWLRQRLAASQSPWNVVYFHHPAYSSDAFHGSLARMQWPFAAWGADVVISGHVHTYERINRDGIVYFVNGAGGERPLYTFAAPVAGSQVRFNATVGAQIATATDTTLEFSFITANGQLVDSYRLNAASTAK